MNNTKTSLAYLHDVISGNVLVASFHTRANISTPTIADTLSSTWTLRLTRGTTNTWVYRGANTVTAGLTIAAVWVGEWTNIQTIFDTGVVSLLNANAGGSPITSGSITAPVSEMLYSVAVPGTAAATISINSPFTSDENFSLGPSPIRVQAGYEIGASAGSQTASYTVSGNTSNDSAIMLFNYAFRTSPDDHRDSAHREPPDSQPSVLMSALANSGGLSVDMRRNLGVCSGSGTKDAPVRQSVNAVVDLPVQMANVLPVLARPHHCAVLHFGAVLEC